MLPVTSRLLTLTRLAAKYFNGLLMPGIYHIHIVWKINIPSILTFLFSCSLFLRISWLGKSWAVNTWRAVTRQIKNEQTKRIMKIFLVSVMGNVALAPWPAMVMLGQLISRAHNAKTLHSGLVRWHFMTNFDRLSYMMSPFDCLTCWPIQEAPGHYFYILWGSTDPCGPNLWDWNVNPSVTFVHAHPVKAFNHRCQISQVDGDITILAITKALVVPDHIL